MKESVLLNAFETLWQLAQSVATLENLDAACAALALMILLRATVYHRMRHEIFEFSGARLSMCGAINKARCYFCICCCGFLVFQIVRGRLL